MAFVELNIYNDNDEIVKTFSTNRVRWGLIVKAVEIEERFNDENITNAEVIKILNEFMLSVFPTMTQKDVEMADFNDIKNVFKMVGNLSKGIDTKNA